MSPEMQIPTTGSLTPCKPYVPPATKALTSRILPLVRQVSQALALAACAFLSYFLISHFLVQSVRVVGMSMVPTLQDSQFYLLNRWVLHFRDPHRSEIVVLRDPLDGGFAVKRIIAVAGDSVELAAGNVYVNGQKITEKYLPAGTLTFTTAQLQDVSFKCQTGQYFVLGDNRNNSLDSRAYGPISRQSILGLIIR